MRCFCMYHPRTLTTHKTLICAKNTRFYIENTLIMQETLESCRKHCEVGRVCVRACVRAYVRACVLCVCVCVCECSWNGSNL